MTSAMTAIFDFLAVAGTGLATLVGTRITYKRAPSGFLNTETRIVLDITPGGSEHASGATHRVPLQAKCYGGTINASDAETVFRALRDRLQRGTGTVNGRRIMYAFSAGPGQPLDEEKTGWPFHLGQFMVTVEE